MGMPLLAPLRDLLQGQAGIAAARAATVAATLALVGVAVALSVAAGLVVLTAEIGFPRAALSFAGLFAVLALATYLLGRALSARREAQAAAARERAQADLALASAVVRSARPLLPVAAFVAAFVLMRRP